VVHADIHLDAAVVDREGSCEHDERGAQREPPPVTL
jgi:hypothetical protein